MSVDLLVADDLAPDHVGRCLREDGGFLLAMDESLCDRTIDAAHEFFASPRSEKEAVAIERSAHYRGWSEMHNERDWREQIHFGRELPARPDHPPYSRLEGPNQWPSSAEWRSLITTYMTAVAAAGERVLTLALQDLGVASDIVNGVAEEGYVLLKLIAYHPQPSTGEQRQGVAAHVDFSWITLTLQDSRGLEIRRPDGTWIEVEPRFGALWVHAGELLELASRGRYRATPHRVVNRSVERTRVSLPLFLNPRLSDVVETTPSHPSVHADGGGAHVHRVVPPADPPRALHFGEAEWRRKGLNAWCHACAPPRADLR